VLHFTALVFLQGRETNGLVRLAGMKKDAAGNPRFVAVSRRRRKSLHPRRPGPRVAKKIDYGIILRMQSPVDPDRWCFVCGGLGEFGTSGAAWFLAHQWPEIAEKIRDATTTFACIVRVDDERDATAKLVRILQ
jgi:hypothetical protein